MNQFKLLKYIILALILFAAVSSVAALSAGEEVIDPEPLADPMMVRDERAPAMLSIAAMYSPQENKDHWLKFVCTGMTEGGCNFFKDNHAAVLWANTGSSAGGFISDETIINDTAQVWKAQVTIFPPSGEKITSAVFVLVERGANGNWYLNRVLYGPWISQEEF